AISVVDDGESLGFAYVDPAGTAVVGYPDEPFSPAPEAEVSDARVTAVPDAQVLTFAEISNRGREVSDIRVPIGEDPPGGFDAHRRRLARVPRSVEDGVRRGFGHVDERRNRSGLHPQYAR